MGARDPRIDQYIAGPQPFARPILVFDAGAIAWMAEGKPRNWKYV